jgi:hypothetical protein
MKHGRIPLVFAAALLLLVGAEGVVRAVQPRLREPLVWSDSEMQSKVERIDEIDRSNARTSVLFLGSSMVNAAADPVLASRLIGPGREPVFNGAFNGADARSLAFFTEHVALPRLRPRVVVIGASSVELNDNGITQDRFWDKLNDAPAARLAAGHGDVVERAEAWVEERSALVRYRTELRRPVTVLRGTSKKRASVSPLGVIGSLPEFHRRPYGIRPDFRFRTEQETYRNFALGGDQLRALDGLVGVLRGRGVDVVIVNMPVTDDALAMHPGGREDYERAARALETLARERDVRFVDMSSNFPSHDGFVDPLHLNAAGAKRFTERLVPVLRQLLA